MPSVASGSVPLAEDLVPVPSQGRVFRARRTVRLGDADPSGRLRLDALARYLQDVSADDTDDAGLEDSTWVVRRTVLDVVQPPVEGEALTLTTFCSGIGGRWAERRVDVEGERGGRVAAATTWIHVDPTTGRPARLPAGFAPLYAEAAGDRTVTTRLRLGAPRDGLARRPWPLRATDFDRLGHVNNAASWEVVEEVLAGRPDLHGPVEAELEFVAPIGSGEVPSLVADGGAGPGLAVWLVGAAGEVLLAGAVRPRVGRAGQA